LDLCEWLNSPVCGKFKVDVSQNPFCGKFHSR
jgi:hypothetical protein